MSNLNRAPAQDAMPTAALSTFMPPTPEELARWHYEQAQFWLDVVHDKTGLTEEYKPRLVITYRFPASLDEGGQQ